MDIKKKADKLARKFQTRNPFEIIQGLNVILVFAPLIDTRAFYQYFQRNNIIYIDENLPDREKIFDSIRSRRITAEQLQSSDLDHKIADRVDMLPLFFSAG